MSILIARPTGTDAKKQTVSAAFTDEDLWASIGGAANEKQFEMRTLALTKPTEYETKRKEAMAKLKEAAAATFTATYAAYDEAGFSSSEAKRLALAASKANYSAGASAMRALFPSATDNIYQAKATDQYVMMARASARSAPNRSTRKTPAKRKKPAQKRR